jgi:hypothetical protein
MKKHQMFAVHPQSTCGRLFSAGHLLLLNIPITRLFVPLELHVCLPIKLGRLKERTEIKRRNRLPQARSRVI